jgi:two-component system, NarL family, sensor histidine kinase DesK
VTSGLRRRIPWPLVQGRWGVERGGSVRGGPEGGGPERGGPERGGPERPFGPARLLGMCIWLAFIVAPVVDAVTNTGSPSEHWLAVGAAVVFSVVYVWLALTWWEERTRWRPIVLTTVMLAMAIVLTVADRPSWGFLFAYVAAVVGLVVPSVWGLPAVIAVAAAGAACTLIGGANSGVAAGYGVSAVGVGLLLVLLRDLRMRNRELSEARAELALSAVEAERARFARDLHDLLGHSLSVIAIKAELAGRLMSIDPVRAAAEVADVEGVARESLREVRQAVSGYRQPTLEKELEGARVALSAAGITAEVERAPVTLDPEVEAVLAWTVREGATNVIRHSGATHCQVRVRADLGAAGVEVVDDGEGPASVRGAEREVPGHGIAGLGERAERLRGQIEAGGRPDGRGFRLAVSIPVSAVAGS